MNRYRLYRWFKGGYWILTDYQGHGSYTAPVWEEVTGDAWHDLRYDRQHSDPRAMRCLKFEMWRR